LPLMFLKINIDGLETFFEWTNAGRCTCQAERGTMALVARGPMQDVYYGFSLREFFVRIDFDQPAKQSLQSFEVLRVAFEEPHACELRIFHPGKPTQSSQWYAAGKAVDATGRVRIGIDRIAEVAIPYDLIEAEAKKPVQFYVELLENQQSRDRAPREGNITFTWPAPEFEQMMWDV
jgi:hypothetical protein